MAGEIPESLWIRVAERAYRVCEYCLVHEDDLYHGCEVDHIISVKHGGTTTEANLAFACFHCNRHKGSDLGSISRVSGKLVRFFNPRNDRWNAHFQSQDGEIEGLTEIGEVTARILEFNQPERLTLRRLLTNSGRYPSIGALALLRE